MVSQMFSNKVDRLGRHVSVIEEELEQLTNQNFSFGLQKENLGILVKGESLCQQGLVSILKYMGKMKSEENRGWTNLKCFGPTNQK